MQNQNLPPHPFKDEVLQISPQGLARLSAEFDPKEPAKHIYWTTDYTMELPIAIKKSGPGIYKKIDSMFTFQQDLNQQRL